MLSNILEPSFIYPIDKTGIFYHPTNAVFLMSENPVPRGAIVKMGDLERSIKHSEELSIIVWTQSSRLRISKGFMEIDSKNGVQLFIEQLGFSDRRSFLMATMTNCETNGNCAKRKLILHHLFEHTIQPPL